MGWGVSLWHLLRLSDGWKGQGRTETLRPAVWSRLRGACGALGHWAGYLALHEDTGREEVAAGAAEAVLSRVRCAP
jgi:hypothetical protein